MKRKWTPYPANIWDVEAVERWLEDEAARGWRLDGSRQWGGGLVRLLRTEPAVCRVRVQPVGFVSQEAWQERLETFRELGWTFGATFDWHFHMAAFYCDDPAVPELDTDMEVWAMVWRKAFVWGLWESVGLGALGLALLASMVLLGWEFTVTEPLVLLAVQVLGGAGLTLWAALSVPKLLRLRRQASAGLREPPGGSWRRAARWGRVFAVALVLSAPLINLGNLFHQAEKWDTWATLPALTVQAADGEDWDIDLRVGVSLPQICGSPGGRGRPPIPPSAGRPAGSRWRRPSGICKWRRQRAPGRRRREWTICPRGRSGPPCSSVETPWLTRRPRGPAPMTGP